jgi:hypothetical protein
VGEEILLDSVGTDTASVTFREHHPKRALKGHQSFLPHGDDALLAIQLSLLSKKLPL